MTAGLRTCAPLALLLLALSQAVRAYGAGDWYGAIAVLEELLDQARPGLQTRLLDHLRGEIEYWRD